MTISVMCFYPADKTPIELSSARLPVTAVRFVSSMKVTQLNTGSKANPRILLVPKWAIGQNWGALLSVAADTSLSKHPYEQYVLEDKFI